MEVTGTFKGLHRRQIQDVLAIKNSNPKEDFNSKSEFHEPRVKRKMLEAQTYQCNLCNFETSSMYVLKRHMNTKQGSPNYTCTECGMSFTKEAGHKRHTQNFHKHGDYQCIQCGMSFNRSTHLKKYNNIFINM